MYRFKDLLYSSEMSIFSISFHGIGGFLCGSSVKNLPAMQELQEMWVQSLGWEDPLEERMAPTLVFLPGESHGQRSLVGYSPWGHKESETTEST